MQVHRGRHRGHSAGERVTDRAEVVAHGPGADLLTGQEVEAAAGRPDAAGGQPEPPLLTLGDCTELGACAVEDAVHGVVVGEGLHRHAVRGDGVGLDDVVERDAPVRGRLLRRVGLGVDGEVHGEGAQAVGVEVEVVGPVGGGRVRRARHGDQRGRAGEGADGADAAA